MMLFKLLMVSTIILFVSSHVQAADIDANGFYANDVYVGAADSSLYLLT